MIKKHQKLLKHSMLGVCFLLLTTSYSQAQQKITGTVTDSDALSLIGVNILEEGTGNGTVTDIDGSYELEVGPNAVLEFSYTGYQSQSITVGGQSRIDVTMASGAYLDEVVVIGYGTRKKSDLTGSVVSVGSKDFDKQPLTRIDQALQGRTAGVQVNQTSGAPGAAYKIRIRGANSISGNNDPLYVVDGLVVGDISAINVNDIASLEVLKDASATAIYGSRGANGVILISTKTGTKGGSKIEISSFIGQSDIYQRLDVMTPAEFAEGVNFAEGTEFFSPAAISALQNGGGEDWQERFFRTGTFYNTQASFSGGSEKTDYFISAGLYSAEGTIINQDYKRYSLRANINSKLTDKLKVGMNIYGTREDNTGVRANLSTGLTWDLTTPAFNADGDYNFTPLIPGVGNGTPNQLLQPENNVRDNFDNQIIARGYVDYSLMPGLTLNISGGADQLNRNNNSYTSILINATGNARVYNQNISRYQNTNRLSYTNDDNPNHRFQIDAIHEQQLVTNSWAEATSDGFFSDNTTYNNLSLGAIQRTNNQTTSESLQSYLGRVNYTLMERFLFTASLRADGSSKFRADNRWGIFPSGSVAWRLSEESFVKESNTIDNFKVRASWGITGNQGIEPLATRAQPITNSGNGLSGINYPFGGAGATVGIAPSARLANPDLTWEKTSQINAGFDIGLWNSAFTFSFDVFKKNTTDLLLDVFLPEFVGPTVVAQNIGEVENKGFDIALGYTPVRTKDLVITNTLSISRYRNEVIALVDDQPIEKGNSFASGIPVFPTRVEVGQPISAFRGYEFLGVYQLGEEDEAASFGRNVGDGKYADLNNDGAITVDDITTVGDGNPDLTWGLNSNISYKNFDFNFLLLGSHGNDIYNLQRGRMMALGSTQFHATHGDYRDRWTTSNPSDIPSGRDGTQFLSSQFIEDGSYLTMKNVSLAYTLTDALKSIGAESLRLNISLENPFIITGYSGFDPESTATGNSDVDLGIDYNTFPISRSISFGFNLIF